MKKNLTLVILLIFSFVNVNAKFMYDEIDPICSISGTTHTSFPGEISDTSSWHIPKAYDGECIKVPTLNINEKKIITKRVIKIFEDRDFIKTKLTNGYTLTSKGEKFAQNIFFSAVKNYIIIELEKPSPNKKSISILNYAVSIIGYDYFINDKVEDLNITNEPELKTIDCLKEQRNVDSCIEIYQPVCGKVEIQCITTPCNPINETFENYCKACNNPRVISYTYGKCFKSE